MLNAGFYIGKDVVNMNVPILVGIDTGCMSREYIGDGRFLIGMEMNGNNWSGKNVNDGIETIVLGF
jgi:hypothetical protein